MTRVRSERDRHGWERLDWEARIRGDRVRRWYAIVRRASTPRVWVARRPRNLAPSFEIDPARGFRIFDPGTFPETDAVVRRGQELLSALAPTAASDPNKDFFASIVDESEFTSDHPLVQLALRPDILDAVTRYLGCVPLLRDVMYRWSPSIEHTTLRSSQLFHCDGEDTRQVKIFVLCSAVGQENGPLQIVDAETSARLRRLTNYAFRARLPDERAVEALGHVPLTPVLGTPGTLCLVDTSRCFHYGSRVERAAAPRLVANIQYLSPFAFTLPRDVSRAAKFAHLVGPESDARTRLVLGAV